jgi:hypothetical protein
MQGEEEIGQLLHRIQQEMKISKGYNRINGVKFWYQMMQISKTLNSWKAK